MSVLQSFNRSAESLTKAQQHLARYVLDHSAQVAFMTAKELGEATGQSDAAVVRFARALGYDGLPGLRAALREGLLERAGASGLGPSRGARSDLDALKSEVFESDSALIAATAGLNSTADGKRIVDLLISAGHIWVTGHGTTYPMAAYLAFQLSQLTGKADVLNVGDGDTGDRLRRVQRDHVLIGIGYVRYLPYTIDLMRAARESGARIVAITDRPSSPLARLAHHTLLVARNGSSMTWWSQAGTMALANWLTSMLLARDADRVAKQLRSADEALRRLDLWRGVQSTGEDTLEASLKAALGSRSRPAAKRAGTSSISHTNP